MKVLIENSASHTNLGDKAILEMLVEIIQYAQPSASIIVHSTEPEMHRLGNVVVRSTIYDWAVFKKPGLVSRSVRMASVILAYIAARYGLVFIPLPRGLREVLDDIREADVVIYTGGGYLRTKKGIKQALNLSMQLLPLKFAQAWRTKVVFAPISFGPFYYSWQEQWVARALQTAEAVVLREEVSYQRLKDLGATNISLSSDLAFAMPATQDAAVAHAVPVIGFTVRKWFKGEAQDEFEQSFARELSAFAKAIGAELQPIVQVHDNQYGDKDEQVAQSIAQRMRKEELVVRALQKPRTVKEALRAYAHVDMLIGVRMHSNILAALSNTPFVAIAYEHKTDGIARQLGIPEVALPISTEMQFANVAKEVWANRNAYREKFNATLPRIREEVVSQLQTLLVPARRPPQPSCTVTIGIAAYNAEKNIGHMAHALLGQKMQSAVIEKVIVHIDEGVDNTAAVLNAYANPKLTVIETKPRSGFAHAFRRLLTESQSDVVILLNDDIQILDEYFIEKLTQPFLEDKRVGLVSGNPEPLPAVNFVDRAIISSHKAWDTMRRHMAQGNNAFTVDGKIMALSRECVNALTFPQDPAHMANVDSYVYLECKAKGFEYRFVDEAVVHYRNPTTVKEHIQWGTRNNSNEYILPKVFGNLYYKEYQKPKLLYISSLAKEFLSNPIGSTFIFLSSFYVRYKAVQYAKSFNSMWDVVSTTKDM